MFEVVNLEEAGKYGWFSCFKHVFILYGVFSSVISVELFDVVLCLNKLRVMKLDKKTYF